MLLSKDDLGSIRGVTEFRNVLEVLNDRQGITRLMTGSADLDSLLGGGIEPGQFYLFYGDIGSGVDNLIHQILVNSLLPVEKSGFGGKCVYSNCGNYRLERTMLNTELLCYFIKAAKLNLVNALHSIYTICSFSEEQQEKVFEDIQILLAKDPEIKLVVVHNIAKLFTTNTKSPNRNAGERIARLQKVVFRLWQVCAENNLGFVASCRPSTDSKVGVPKPEGGRYMSHKATVIVYFRRRTDDTVQAYLVKHPNRSPRRISLKSTTGGNGLGRITLPFRTILQQEMDNLKRTYREALMHAGRRDAFDSLTRAWSSEQGAMSHAKVPTALDVMLLTAVVDNRRLIEDIYDKLEAVSPKLDRTNARSNDYRD